MKIAAINGLRGLAICGVVSLHSFFNCFQYGLAKSDLPIILQTVLSSGWLGVNLFFMLSGLVLYLPYAGEERTILRLGDASEFYKRRFYRLFPLYWFICIISLVFIAEFRLDDPMFYGWFMSLAIAIFPFHPDTFLPKPVYWALWSIGIEIWFSVLFPLLVVLLNRFGWRRVFIATMAMSFSIRMIGDVLLYAAPQGIILNSFSDSVLGRMDEFMFGMLLARLIALSPACQRGEGLFTAQRASLGVFGIALAMYCWGAWFRLELPGWSAALYAWPLDLGMFFLIGYLINSTSVLRRVIEVWPLQLLGMMCYSIYLWHGIVLKHFGASFNVGVFEYGAYLAVVLLLSWFTYRYIEFGQVRELRNLLPAKGREQ